MKSSLPNNFRVNKVPLEEVKKLNKAYWEGRRHEQQETVKKVVLLKEKIEKECPQIYKNVDIRCVFKKIKECFSQEGDKE